MSFHRLLVPRATRSAPRARAERTDYLDSRPQSHAPAVVSPEGPSPRIRARCRGALESPFRWRRRQVGVLSGLSAKAQWNGLTDAAIRVRWALLVLAVPRAPPAGADWPGAFWELLLFLPPVILLLFFFFSASEAVGRQQAPSGTRPACMTAFPVEPSIPQSCLRPVLTLPGDRFLMRLVSRRQGQQHGRAGPVR